MKKIVTIETIGRGKFKGQRQEEVAPSVTSTAYEQNTFVVIEYDYD